MDPYETLLYPLMGEKATLLREKENTLTFIVAKEATKKDIKEAAEKMLNVKVERVRVMHTTGGQKKAHVRLNEKHKADEIASHMGVL
jgi:large subunit ribosomal protein L23